MRIIAILLSSLILAGCSRETNKSVKTPDGDSSPAQPVSAPVVNMTPPAQPGIAPTSQQNPSDVVATVNGREITREQVMFALKNAGRQGQRGMKFKDAVQSLVGNVLITDLIEKENITVTKQDALAMRQTLAKTIPKGKTLEQFMKEQGISDQFLQRVIEGRVKLEKILRKNGADTSVTDKELALFIQENKSRLGMSKELRQERLNLIKDIRKQLLAGADFAELARKYSVCPSGKRAGGDLGKFGRGQMAKPFEEAAFSQKINVIGPIVETQFGFHIIKVTDKKAEGEVKEGNTPIPEYVQASHILLKAAPPIQREAVRTMLGQKKTQEALVALVDRLQMTADIKYVNIPQQGTPPSARSGRVRPPSRIKPDVTSKPEPRRISPKNMVVSKPVQSPAFKLEEVQE